LMISGLVFFVDGSVSPKRAWCDKSVIKVRWFNALTPPPKPRLLALPEKLVPVPASVELMFSGFTKKSAKSSSAERESHPCVRLVGRRQTCRSLRYGLLVPFGSLANLTAVRIAQWRGCFPCLCPPSLIGHVASVADAIVFGVGPGRGNPRLGH